MRSHVFLNPMSPDGTPGEVREIQVSEEPVQFLAPVSYASNDAERDRIRKAVSQAETDLLRAQSRGASPTELLRYESAVRIAKRDLDQAEDPGRRQRARETGIGRDDIPPASHYAPIVPYFVRQSAVSDELKAKVKAAVDALEKAISAEAPEAEIEKLEENLRVLREQLQHPEQALRSDPPRKDRIGERPTGSKNTLAEFAAKIKAAVEPPKPATPPKKESGLARWIREVWEPQQAKRMLEKLRDGGATVPVETAAPSAPSTHSAGSCCSGKYLCASCAAKKAAAA
jgi:hypothetical protein